MEEKTRAGRPCHIPDDARIPRSLVPPVAGKGERWAGRVRIIAAVIWGVYLVGVFTLPQGWLYDPTMAVFDAVLWPVVRMIGRAGAVAVVAGAMAALTMIGQWWLTDNKRLREAKRRAAVLEREARDLPADSPRAKAIARLSMPVQGRVVMAALTPLAVLLGPMVMSFIWLPQRVESFNAAPGAGGEMIVVTATVNGDLRTPVRLEVDPKLTLREDSPAEQSPEPIRQALEDLSRDWQVLAAKHPAPPELADAMRLRELMVSDMLLADLKDYLAKGLPPQTMTWKLLAEPDAVGRFPVTVKTGAESITAHVVLGDRYAPAPEEVLSDGGTSLVSLKVAYPKAKTKQRFWSAMTWWEKRPGWMNWLSDWLLVYLVVYLPCMFGVKWGLGVV